MPIPDYQTLMRPLLAYGQDGAEKNIGEAIKVLADEFHLGNPDKPPFGWYQHCSK
jgi:restriction endonuclease Mrr